MPEMPKENWSNEDDLHSDALTASHRDGGAGLQVHDREVSGEEWHHV